MERAAQQLPLLPHRRGHILYRPRQAQRLAGVVPLHRRTEQQAALATTRYIRPNPLFKTGTIACSKAGELAAQRLNIPQLHRGEPAIHGVNAGVRKPNDLLGRRRERHVSLSDDPVPEPRLGAVARERIAAEHEVAAVQTTTVDRIALILNPKDAHDAKHRRRRTGDQQQLAARDDDEAANAQQSERQRDHRSLAHTPKRGRDQRRPSKTIG